MPMTVNEQLGLGLGVAGLLVLALVASQSGSPAEPSPSPGPGPTPTTPVPGCPTCGLYRTPDGRAWVVDGDARSYWIQDAAAREGCGYNLSDIKAISYQGMAACEPGPTITSDCGTCPCTGPLGLFDWCSTVPCPGCLF